MKMKRFFAASMQQALKEIREELGADAVILSSKKMDGGVEVICALNYDESEAREQLPETHRESASPSSVAKEAAARHSRLESEMVKVRSRIDALRDQKGAAIPPAASAPGKSAAEEAETGRVLAEMREEIQQLRSLIQHKQQMDSAAPASFAASLAASMNDSSAQTGVAAPVHPQPEPAVGVAESQPEVASRLSRLGIFSELQPALLSRLDAEKTTDENWRTLMARLAHGLRTEKEELIDQEGHIALLGPTGVGKTTTIAKMAARFVQKYGNRKLALVTTDRFRVAGTQQLQSFGRLLNVPVIVVDEQRSLDDVLDELADKRLILIDTAGLNPQDPNWDTQRRDLRVERHELRNYLVLSAVNQPQVMKSTYHYYKMLGLSGCIMTKLDEAFSLGEVISMSIVNRLPVAYFTDGQQIPKDIHVARAHALVVKAVSLMQAAEEWEKQKPADTSVLRDLVV